MTRTIVIGKADEEIKKVYNTVLTAQKAALEQIRGSMPCRNADAIARKIIDDAGYGKAFGHSLGHGVGMFIHEKPNLSPRADEKLLLQAGNVVTVEPGIYLEAKFGCRIEDMILINPDGTTYNFTKSNKNLIEIWFLLNIYAGEENFLKKAFLPPHPYFSKTFKYFIILYKLNNIFTAK